VKPRGFDASKKYPAIVYIYGGPGAPTVNDAWDYSFANNALFDQVLAARGYVVFSVDPRSATGQSKTLENTVLRSSDRRHPEGRRRRRALAEVTTVRRSGAGRRVGLERRRHGHAAA
jgi:hypothetical protein